MQVLLLEKNNRLGKKLLITGKGRCNVTNDCAADEVLRNVPRNGRFLYSAMNQLPPQKVCAFFEENGLTPRGSQKTNETLIYFRKSTDIEDFFALANMNQTAFEVMNAKNCH